MGVAAVSAPVRRCTGKAAGVHVMTGVWGLAALWLGLALIASLLSIWLRISTALSEIVVGTIAQLIIGAVIGSAVLGTDESWIKFLSGIGAIVLTFLAGAELDPQVFKLKWQEATAIGLAGFFFPFLGCAAAAYYLLGWEPMPSWLAGVAMSTTSVAVVYAVMLEYGFNVTEYGKTVLAACFINDLGTVVALGLIFAPFTMKTLIFLGVGIVVFVILPWLTPRFFRLYGNRPSELETKFLLFCLLGMGALASWADSEAVLPAYLIGMVLAGYRRQGSCARPTPEDIDVRTADAVLLHSRGLFCFDTRACRSPSGIFVFLSRQGRHEDRRSVSCHQILQGAKPGGDVHDPSDVDRTDIRDDIVAVRPQPRHHRQGSIFGAGRHGHRQRRRADSYCERLLFAASPVAQERAGSALATAGVDHAAAGCDASRLKRGQPMFTEILDANDGSDPPLAIAPEWRLLIITGFCGGLTT